MSVEQYRVEIGLAAPGVTAPDVRRRAARSTGPSNTPRSSRKSDAATAMVLAKSTQAGKARVRGGTLVLASGEPSEEAIHRDCAEWVFEHEVMFPVLRHLMHVPNGGHRSRGEAGKLRAMGVRPGVSDWVCPFPSPAGTYPGLAIELKSRTGRVSPEQLEFLVKARTCGWLAAVARSKDEFVDLVAQWLELRL